MPHSTTVHLFQTCLLCCSCMFFSAAAWPQAAPSSDSPVREVVIVSKTHFDIGYTDRVANVLNRYRAEMMDGALTVMDQTASLPTAFQFSWTLPGWPLTQILGPEQTPARRERIMAGMKSGRIVWHALPFTMHTESLDLEDLVRGLGYSSALSRMMGQPLPTDAKMTDVASHSWILPTLLVHAGVKFLHLGCNPACQSPRVPSLFWWEGPDGSRLLTFYSPGNYGTGLLPPKDWPHKTWLAMLMTGDNQGPPTLEEARKLEHEAAKKLPGVKVRFGRLSDFADALLAENPDLPVVRGDMPDTWIHGLESMPVETALAREWRPQIGAANSLDTLMRCWGLAVPDIHDAVASAYENSLLYGEHTWGSNGTKPGPFRYGADWKQAREGGGYKEFEASFEDHRAYSRKVAALTEPILQEHMAVLARAVNVSGPRIVVFNPLPWTRDALVAWKQPSLDAKALKNAATGAVEPVSLEDGACRFVARALPPMGYATFVPAPAPPETQALMVDEAKGVLENAFLRVTIDAARGGVQSVIDKRTGRELVNTASPYRLGQYLYERFSREQTQKFGEEYITKPEQQWAWNDLTKVNLPEGAYRSDSPGQWSVHYQSGPVMAVATLCAQPGGIIKDPVTLTVTLHRDLPGLDLAWSVKDKTPDPWPEAGWMCLPLNGAPDTFRLGRIGAIIDPARDIITGSNRHVFCLNSGMTVADTAGAVTGICPMDSPLVSLGKPGLWQFSLDYTPANADVFVNLFNNQWSTNFPLWIDGSWTSRVRLWAAETADPAASLLTPAWNTRTACPVGIADGASGPLPPSQPGLTLSRDGVLVTAFGPNPDGPGHILRLWEQSGRNGACSLQLPEGFATKGARLVNLRGEAEDGEVVLSGRNPTLSLKAYAPCTVLFPGK